MPLLPRHWAPPRFPAHAADGGVWYGSVTVRWAAVLLYLVLCLPQLGRPLLYDEVDFAKAARAAAAGTLRYDRGYIDDYPWSPESGRRLQHALYHPPGYVLALAGWQRVAGESDAALRGFGVLCGLASLALAAALARLAGGAGAGAWAAVAWATSPYAIQSALLLDIDGTVLPPLTAAFVWLCLRRASPTALGAPAASPPHAPPHVPPHAGASSRHTATEPPEAAAPHGASAGTTRSGAWSAVASAAVFALALWCKLTTPAVVATLLLVWLIASRRHDAARRVALAAGAGALLFLGTWGAFAAVAGLPVLQPFRDTWYEALDAAGLASAGQPDASGRDAQLDVAPPLLLALRTMVGLLRSLQWLHPLLAGVLLAAPLALRRREPAAALLFIAATSFVLYLPKFPAGFPKYHAGVLPLAAAVVGVAGARWYAGRQATDAAHPAAARRHRTDALWPGAGFALAAAASLAVGPDRLIREADLALLAAWIAVANACLAAGWWLGAHRAGGFALGLLLGAGVSLASLHALHGPQGWSTTYFYGTAGQVRAAAWLRDNALPDEVVVADREVAYYAGAVHFLDSERFLAYLAGADRTPETLPPSPRLIVTRHARIADLLPAGARLAATFGPYYAWVLDGALVA